VDAASKSPLTSGDGRDPGARLKVLVTGFVPFNDDPYNASGITAHWLDGQQIHAAGPGGFVDADIIGEGDVPVIGAAAGGYHSAADVVIDLIRRHCPDLVVCLGQGEDTNFRVEQKATDQGDPPADPQKRSAGVAYHDPRIARSEGYRETYDATLDADRIAAAIRAAGGDARANEGAGRYVCEDLLYHVLRYAEQQAGTGARLLPVGFIHVPRRVRVDVPISAFVPADAPLRRMPGFGTDGFAPNAQGAALACVAQSLINAAIYKAVEAAALGVVAPGARRPSPGGRGARSWASFATAANTPAASTATRSPWCPPRTV
jgi:pyroglutamyl-peptidase